MTTVGPHVFLCDLKQRCNISLITLCFHEWMKMLTFGFLFCSFDLKMWNVAIKIIRPKTINLYILVKAKQSRRHMQFHLNVPSDQCTS